MKGSPTGIRLSAYLFIMRITSFFEISDTVTVILSDTTICFSFLEKE